MRTASHSYINTRIVMYVVQQYVCLLRNCHLQVIMVIDVWCDL